MWALGSWDVLRMKKPFFFSNDISIVMTLRKAGPSHLILQDLLILPNTKFSSGSFFFFLPVDLSVCHQQPDRITRVSIVDFYGAALLRSKNSG